MSEAAAVLAVVAPGQGSQTAGFLRPWLELPEVEQELRSWSDVTGTDLVQHGTESDAETIRDTAVAQPLIVAAGLLTAGRLGLAPDAAARVGVLAGHSVGEFTAAALAGVLGADDALALVAERGRAMAAAARLTPTGMSAVLGGDPDEVAAALDRHGLTAANLNAAGQVVAAGRTGALAALAADPPARARVTPLAVAGAFHTAFMAPAVERLAAVAAAVRPADPAVRLLSNADGAEVTAGGEALDRLVAQVSRPVRWDRCQDRMRDLGVTALIELAPAGTLAGIARRTLRGIEIVAVRTPDDLDAARDLLARHAPEAVR